MVPGGNTADGWVAKLWYFWLVRATPTMKWMFLIPRHPVNETRFPATPRAFSRSPTDSIRFILVVSGARFQPFSAALLLL